MTHYFGAQTKIGMIFDVGANVGQSGLEFAKNFPEAAIHSFEPFKANFNKLVHNTQDTVAIRSHHLALSDRDGFMDVLVDNLPNSEWNGITEKRQLQMKISSDVSKETVLLSRGDSFCEVQGISCIDILKIDTEGHDLEVIEGFEGMFEKGKILSLIVEVGFLQDQNHGNFQKINSYLIGKGMQLAGFYETCFFESGKCEYTNALYLLRTNG
jgi:FkbM family methyltransferase